MARWTLTFNAELLVTQAEEFYSSFKHSHSRLTLKLVRSLSVERKAYRVSLFSCKTRKRNYYGR